MRNVERSLKKKIENEISMLKNLKTTENSSRKLAPTRTFRQK